MGVSVNYVICCWSGERRADNFYQQFNPPYHLETHLEKLRQYKHNLTQITVALSHNPNEPRAYREFLNILPSKIGQADVVIVERPDNDDFSYGTFSYVFGKYRSEFDYYFFAEDDIHFCQDNFDAIALSYLARDEKIAYVCGMARDYCSWPFHAAIPHGMLRSTALEQVWAEVGHLCPNQRGLFLHKTDYTVAEGVQVGLSQCLLGLGWQIIDFLDEYWAGFYDSSGIWWFRGGEPKLHDTEFKEMYQKDAKIIIWPNQAYYFSRLKNEGPRPPKRFVLP